LDLFLRLLVAAGFLETPAGDDAFDRYRWTAAKDE
jgi:hypothetical protein